MLINRAFVSVPTIGTGTVSLGSPLGGYQSWAAAGAINNTWYSYLIVDGTAWEVGVGLYMSSGTLSRPGPTSDGAFESSTRSLLALSGTATISCTAHEQDYAAISQIIQLTGSGTTLLAGQSYGARGSLGDMAPVLPALTTVSDGVRIAIEDREYNAATDSTTIHASGSDLIQYLDSGVSPTATFTLSQNGAYLVFEAQQFTAPPQWRVSNVS